MDAVPVVFCFDGGFARRAAVAIASLCVHAAPIPRIYCLTSSVTAADRAMVERLPRRLGADIRFIEIDDEFGDWTAVYNISSAAYFRLLIPAVVPGPKALYLDCDLLVIRDLAELMVLNLGDAWLAGCRDLPAEQSSRLSRAAGDPYLNSGVLLMNLDALRAADFARLARETYHRCSSQIEWADQCLINKVAEGRKALIAERWNMLAHEAFQKSSVEKLFERVEGAAILHFSGPVKPWHASTSLWEAALWRGYARLAGVADDQTPQPARTINEWKITAHNREREERWQEAALAYKKLASHFERKAAG